MKAAVYLAFLLQSALSLPHHSSQETTLIVPRQAGPGVFASECRPQKVGKDRTVYKHQQVSKTIDCSTAESCGVNHVDTHSFGWEVSAGATIENFLTVGLAIQESTTMGNEYNCDEKTSKKVCIWASIKYTEYDVQKPKDYNCPRDRPVTTLRAPTKDQGDNHYYCQTDEDCKGIDDHYFNDMSIDRMEKGYTKAMAPIMNWLKGIMAKNGGH